MVSDAVHRHSSLWVIRVRRGHKRPGEDRVFWNDILTAAAHAAAADWDA